MIIGLSWCAMLIPVCTIIFFTAQYQSENRKRTRLIRVAERYTTVLSATNDFMYMAIRYTEAPVRIIHESIERVSSLSKPSETLEKLQTTAKALARSAGQAVGENKASAERAMIQFEAPYGTPGPLYRSILIWVTVLLSGASLVAIQFVHGAQILPLPIILAIVLIGVLVVVTTYRAMSRMRSSRLLTERKAALLAEAFATRREYIRDTGKQCEAFVSELQSYSKYLAGIPQARNFFKGISWLKAICNRIQGAYDASNLTMDAPLFAASAFIRKAGAQEYHTLAKERGVTLQFYVEDGLAFRITPQDFSSLMTAVMDNAVKFSKPGGEVIVRGQRRFNHAVIKVIDYGDGIPADQLQKTFSIDTTQPSDTAPVTEAPALSLHITKIIMARVGGELKISSKPGEGTVVTIIAPKSSRREDLRIPTHILRSTSAVG